MLVLAIFAIPICISDWRNRRIPNIYLLFMLYLTLATRPFIPVKSIAVISASALCAVLLLLVGIGAGDAKLLIISALALNLPNFGALLLFATSIYVGAIFQVILIWLFSARLPKSIPLAFAIFSGSALYLAANMSTTLRQYADALVNSW